MLHVVKLGVGRETEAPLEGHLQEGARAHRRQAQRLVVVVVLELGHRVQGEILLEQVQLVVIK